MSKPLLQRLRIALRDKYDIERELGAGGMGTVFLARDRTLERRVAIKILRPELATAEAAERFLHEARVLANLNHPNVVPVHSAGEDDGIFYYVMEFIDGETLAQRLKRGPLPEDEAVRLATELLQALEAAHARGVVHRDVKPGNILLLNGRAILTDFGIAKPTAASGLPLTEPGQTKGTPSYMAPEQIDGEVSPRTDVHAAGMVLYEMFTGRRWIISRSPADADWTGVPRQRIPALKRALAWSPAERWENAATFRAALEGGTVAGKWVGRLAALAGAIIVTLALWLLLRRDEPVNYDLVVLPVQVLGAAEGTIDGRELARWVAVQLDEFREVQVLPPRIAFPWWEEATAAETSPAHRAAAELGVARAVHSSLTRRADGWTARLEVFTDRGRSLPQPTIRFSGDAGLAEIGDSLTLRLLRLVFEFPDSVRLTGDPEALRQFILGEADFERGAAEPAVRYYEAAVAADPTFVLAWWRLANVWRWVGQPDPYARDFVRLLAEHGHDLDPADSALIHAQLTPAGPQRFERYEDTYRRYPRNDFAAFLYGEELFNRGPLWGIPLDSAVAVLDVAVELNPYWALSYVHLVWAHIRLGWPKRALGKLDSLPEWDAGADEIFGGAYSPDLLRLAYLERFQPGGRATLEGRRQLLARGDEPRLVRLARFAGAFDAPQAQVAHGVVASQRAHPALQGGGHLAHGLGLLELGRGTAALHQLDSAAVFLDTPEARFQAAEATLLLSSLGLARPQAERLSTAREVLLGFVRRDTMRQRAAWALALEARARGDEASRSRYSQELGDSTAWGIFHAALSQADAGLTRVALMMTEPLLALQAVAVPLRGGELRGTLGDPFARSLLHLYRGEWHERLGDRAAADREWLWYEAADIRGQPGAEPLQPAEVDWALGAYARYRRGLNDHARGENVLACRHLRRVSELWAEPDEATAALLRAARAAEREACA